MSRPIVLSAVVRVSPRGVRAHRRERDNCGARVERGDVRGEFVASVMEIALADDVVAVESRLPPDGCAEPRAGGGTGQGGDGLHRPSNAERRSTRVGTLLSLFSSTLTTRKSPEATHALAHVLRQSSFGSPSTWKTSGQWRRRLASRRSSTARSGAESAGCDPSSSWRTPVQPEHVGGQVDHPPGQRVEAWRRAWTEVPVGRS
jgi:hypothetical protein